MNKLFTKIVGAALGLTMAIGVGVAVASNSKEATPVHAAAGDSPIILDGTNLSLSSTATTSDTEKTYGGVTYVVSTGAKTQAVQSGATKNFTSNATILIGKSGTYIYNKTAIPGEITKFEVYANKGASTKVSVGVNFSATAALTSWSATTGTWTATLSTLDSVYDASSKIVSGAKYFRYQVTNANNSQVQIRITYTAQKYTVTYNPNNATSGTVPTDSTQYTNGSTVTVKGNTGSLARTGYTFGGWNTKADGTGTNYVAGSGTFSISANTTLYAKWNLNSYTVDGSGITNGSLSSTANVNHGNPLDIYLNPSSGHTYPDSITVTMGGSTLVEDTDYTYDDSTETHPGEITILEVTGNIVITATCPSSGAVEYDIDYDLSHCSIASAPSTMYSDDAIELTIVPADHYKLPAEGANKVSVTGAVDWYYDDDDGTITIDGAENDLTVSVECIDKETFDVNLSLTNVTKTSGPSGTNSVEEGEEVTFVFAAASANYGLPATITVVMGGDTLDSNDYVWTQSTGTLYLLEVTDDLSVTIIGVARTITSISLSTNKGSYALGDTFTMPTVTANYNVGASENVTASATATGGGLENGVLTSAGTKTITISYGGQSATYTATVTAVVPSTGGIAKVTKTSDLTIGSTVYLVCEGRSKQLSGISTTNTKYGEAADYTTTPVDTYPLTVCAGNGGTGYAFKNSSNNYLYWTSGNSLNQDSTLSNNTSWTVSFDANGNATILNVADSGREIMWNYSSPRFACYSDKTPSYNDTSGYNMVQIYKNYPAVDPTLKWITAEVKSGTYYQGSDVTASDFTVTAHYDDGTTSTPTSDITVTNATLTVIGSNTVTLTYGGKSCNVTVTAVELTSEYTGLSWAQGEYTIIDGQNIDFSKFGTVTAEYDDGETSAAKAISSCTVATYTKSGDVYTKVADLDDGDIITSMSHGKYLGVTYTETNTYTAYSSDPIYVVEAIEDVYTQVKTTTWAKVTSLNAGDKVTFVNENGAKVASGFDSNLITVSSYDSSVSTDFYFEVGKVGDYYTFHNANGYLGNHSTGTSGNNYAYLDAEIDEENNMNYFTVSFDEGNVVITSVYDSNRELQFNSTRFCFYGSNQSVVQLYKGTDGYSPSGESFANTNAVVQKAVLEYAEHFNDVMQCVNNGSTADVASKWSTLSSDFSTAMSGFIRDDLAHFKALFANAYSVEGGDTLQDMLARYDYIVAKYKLSDDFLHSDADRGAVQYVKITPLDIVGNGSNVTAIIVVISVISVSAIGGYFFLRKRREEN